MLDIGEFIRGSELLKAYSIPILSDCLKGGCVKQFQRDEVIYNKGESADAAYIIVSGKVKIFTVDEKGNEQVLSEKGPKEFFGENLSPLSISRLRDSAALAVENCECVVLSNENIKKSIEFNAQILKLTKEHGNDFIFKQLEGNFQDLQNVKIDLSNLNERILKFKDRQVIFFQNDKPEYAYVIISGEVNIRSENQKDEHAINIVLEPGEIFGELGVMKDRPRAGMAVSQGDSEVMILDKEALLRLYGTNDNFKNVLSSLESTYNIPQVGKAKRYESVFYGMPAICLKMDVSKTKTVISYQVVGNDIFCISVLGIENFEKHIFSRSSHEKREIWVKDNLLVGLITYGYWEDDSDLVQMILAETQIGESAVEKFKKSGTLIDDTIHLQPMGEDLVCKCMRVTYKSVAEVVKAGVKSVDQVCRITGAGAVCGACKPKIMEVMGSNVWQPCKLSKVIKHNEKIWSFQFLPVNPQDKVTFLAGQHVVLRFHLDYGWVERPYTLTSHPQDEFYEVTIKKEEKGALSSWLFDHATEGRVSYVSKPQGDFVLKYPLQKSVLFIVGGIGVTPVIAMGKMIKGGTYHSIFVDYSYRDENDRVCKSFFDSLGAQNPLFKIRYRNTSVEGRIKAEELSKHLSLIPNADIYICGPEEFNRNVKKILVERLKIEPKRIFIEEFTHVGGHLHKKE